MMNNPAEVEDTVLVVYEPDAMPVVVPSQLMPAHVMPVVPKRPPGPGSRYANVASPTAPLFV
jgi:hypothetical protein